MSKVPAKTSGSLKARSRSTERELSLSVNSHTLDILLAVNGHCTPHATDRCRAANINIICGFQ